MTEAKYNPTETASEIALVIDQKGGHDVKVLDVRNIGGYCDVSFASTFWGPFFFGALECGGGSGASPPHVRVGQGETIF